MTLASDLSPWLARGLAFVFGAIWGSFFNVAIHRWPRGMSVVAPPSHCPACGARIPGWRNVPIVGWIVLRGRAACCGARISPRYVLVETMSSLLCVALVERAIVGAPPATELATAAIEALVYFAFVGGLIVATFVDLDFAEIPDEVSIPGAALGLATASIRGAPGVEEAAFGAGSAFLTVQLLFVWGYEMLTGRRGMGEGDAKLLMMTGAFIGWRGALFALVAGAVQGLVVAVVAIVSGKSLMPEASEDSAGFAEHGGAGMEAGTKPEAEPGSETGSETEPETEDDEDAPPEHAGHLKVPFGPFLALGALEFLFFGEWILECYFALFG
ncbi:MAG: prepilin peptidase [Polyangiales bacterium]